jgi:hypothetical protein
LARGGGVAREIRLLEKAISIVIRWSEKLASRVDSDTDLSEGLLLEELQQTAVALHYLEEAIPIVMQRSKELASGVDSDTNLSEGFLLEELQQTAIALHYELEALKVKLGRSAPSTVKAPGTSKSREAS